MRVRVFSAPPQHGTALTASEHVLEDVRTLVSYMFDIELHPDVDGCRSVAAERVARDLGRLVVDRFDSGRRMLEADTRAPLAAFESLVGAADAHLLLVLRAAKAYERGMFALARGQRDLAYVLLIFVLECLAQVREAPNQVDWEAYPPRERKGLDRAIEEGQVSDEAARRIREILTATKHLRVTANFQEFVLSALGSEFFTANEDATGQASRRLHRSVMPRLLNRAYNTRSGFAHQLAPISEAVSAEWRDEFCILRNGDPAFTFRGLHRVVRGVMTSVLKERRVPVVPVAPPDMPGVVLRRLSYHHWLYHTTPREDGADAVSWMGTLLQLHVEHCVDPHSTAPPLAPIPVARIGTEVAGFKGARRYRPAALALAWICGCKPRGQFKRTIETIVAHVFVEGTCGDDARAAARLMEKHLRGGDSNDLLGFPPLVLVAVWVALAQALGAIGNDAERQRWLELARDDAGHYPKLQSLLSEAVEEGRAIAPHSILFPRTTPGVLLEPFREEEAPNEPT